MLRRSTQKRWRVWVRIGVSMLCASILVLGAHYNARADSQGELLRAKAEKEVGEAEEIKAPSALEASRFRRVHVDYTPSFSPYVRIEYAWSRRGSWLVSSSVAHWPPPIPSAHASSLMEPDAVAEWHRAVRTMLSVATPQVCDEAQNVARGQARLRIEVEGSGDERCFVLREDDETATLPPPAQALTEYAPDIDKVDRWSHPFWLVDESATLRLELKGTADLTIDGDRYGRVNGVLTLRLPAGRRRLTFEPMTTYPPQQVEVFLRKEQTTILRLSVEEEAMTTVPSWSQPRR